jgi:ATP-dependent exoDNAse (exonuclease V) alpha subunit
VNVHRINQGVIPDLRKPDAESDFYFVEAEDPESAVARIIELVKGRIPRRFGLDPIRDIQVLCPMNRGGVGARSINIELQAALRLCRRQQLYLCQLHRRSKAAPSRSSLRPAAGCGLPGRLMPRWCRR